MSGRIFVFGFKATAQNTHIMKVIIEVIIGEYFAMKVTQHKQLLLA
jgi:hypothetical protein